MLFGLFHSGGCGWPCADGVPGRVLSDNFVGGLQDGVIDIIRGFGALIQLGYQCLGADVGGCSRTLGAMGDAIVNHPGDVLGSMIDWKDLSSGNYERWAGYLLPSILLTLATLGVGAGAGAGERTALAAEDAAAVSAERAAAEAAGGVAAREGAEAAGSSAGKSALETAAEQCAVNSFAPGTEVLMAD